MGTLTGTDQVAVWKLAHKIMWSNFVPLPVQCVNKPFSTNIFMLATTELSLTSVHLKRGIDYFKIICKTLSREVKIWLLLNVFKLNCLWCLRTLLKLKYQRDLCKPCCRSHILLDCECFFRVITRYLYRPQTKLREGNVFTGVCHSVQGRGSRGRYITCIMG